MKWLSSHPSANDLGDFASRRLGDSDHARVARHLQACGDCLQTVASLRTLAASSGEPAPGASDALLSRVLRSRAEGRRILLPVHDSKPASDRRPYLLSSVLAGVAALVLLIAPRTAREATGGLQAGFLHFDPATPTLGATVRLSYTPSADLERFDSVVVRARYRRPDDESYNVGPMQRRAAVLHRAANSTFAGALRLPDSVVFAAFAVESPSGNVVDDNNEQLWELVATDAMGRPLFEALVQQQHDLMGRNWERGLKAARRLAAQYPDEPEAWSRLAVYERWVLGDHIADSLLVDHRRRLGAFHRRFSERSSLPSDIVGGMSDYAMQIDDSSLQGYWRARYEREFPNKNALAREDKRLLTAYLLQGHDPARYLADLDIAWRRAGPTPVDHQRMVAQNALGTAMGIKDSAALRVWVERYRRVERGAPASASYWGDVLLQYPTLRPLGMDWLRRETRLLAESPDEYRPLTATVPEQETANRAAAQPILAALGNGLLQDGDTAAGRDTLRLAASDGWNPQVLRKIARTFLAAGDTDEAVRAYARVLADPGASTALGDSIRAMVPTAPAAQWELRIRGAREEMRRATLRDAAPHPLSGPLRIQSRNGEVHPLADLVRGRVTVVMFWSPNCFFSVRALGDLRRLGEQLNGQGVQVLSIVDHPFSNDLETTLGDQKAERLPVYYDVRSDARRAFTTFSLPDYFVLDASGRVMFAHSKLEDLPRQVAALLPTGR
jgi:AhpC/TSA family protein